MYSSYKLIHFKLQIFKADLKREIIAESFVCIAYIKNACKLNIIVLCNEVILSLFLHKWPFEESRSYYNFFLKCGSDSFVVQLFKVQL